MRVVLQRVASAQVRVDRELIGSIGSGLVALLGVESGDTREDVVWLVSKIVQMRIFDDPLGAMNRSVKDSGGGVLLISQFTLLASTKKGNRPSWQRAARPDEARELYQTFETELRQWVGEKVTTGRFGADMLVELINDGPVTLILDSRLRE